MSSMHSRVSLLLVFLWSASMMGVPLVGQTVGPAELRRTTTPVSPKENTLKVLQYNVKQGTPGQICCWHDADIRRKEQEFIIHELLNGGIELASLIESDHQTNGVYDCSSLDVCLGESLANFDSHCSLCPAAQGSFKEALHLVWDTEKWSATQKYSGPACFKRGADTFWGRPFAAVLLQSSSEPSREIVFIGVHPGHVGQNQGFADGAKPLWNAYQDLVGKSTSKQPDLIISGDFNLSCTDAKQQIEQSAEEYGVSIEITNQCSASPDTCCCDNNFSLDYDHVFTTIGSATVDTVIPSAYPGPFTPGGCESSPTNSEEHKPVVATITF